MQLAAQGEGPMVSPQDVAGVLPPLLDMELSRRLVCDVLRDNLRSLIVGQQQQWPPADVERQGPTLDEEAVGAPTLEEPEGQTPSLLTQTTAVAHPVAEIIPRDDPLPTTASPGRPTGLAIAALSSVPTPTETIAPGAAASVVQHALSEPHPVTAWQKQGTAVLPVFAAASAGPAEEQSPTKSQGTQAHGVQGRGVQAHGAEARGVQAHGIVEARAVQAHGMEARGIQAAGVQERGTQAAGIMDRSSQADPPVPHYLLQAALAAGLSYGAGPSLPTNIQTTGLGAGQPVLAQDGAALSMTRPFYLVPADGSQLPSTVSLYGPASGLAFPPYARGEGSRPPLNIPGLSKLRDSSDIDSSTDSMGRHLQAPGARARAAALEALRFASRGSLDSDDGLLQRSYAQLELASLTARPVRLDHHMTSLEDSQLPQRSETGLEQPSSGTTQHPSIDRNDSDERGADASGTGGSGSQVQGRTSQANGMDDGNPIVGNGRPGSEAYRSERGPASHAVGGHAERSGTVPPRYLSRRSSLTSYGSADEPRSGSGGAERESRPRCSDASNGTPIARSQGHSWSALVGAVEHVSSPSQPTTSHAMSLDSCGQQADGVGPRGSGQGSALPSGELSTLSVEQGSVAIVRTPSVYHEGASGLQPAFTVAEAAVTPAVGDDELVREGDFADDDPDEVHSVYFESSLDQVCGTPEAGKTSGTTGANAADDTSEAPAGSGAASTSFGAGTVQKQPRAMVGWTPQSDADEPLGGQCSAGAGEAGNFTLSDDELMDEAEVTRVLAEEDATEAAEDELEDVDEQDEELQLLESQIVQQESSLEVGFGLSAINEPVASGPQEHDSVAVQSSEESPSQGAELVFRGTDSGNGSERGGESAVGSRQTSAMQLSEQSRIVSLEPSTGSGGPDTLGVASRTDSSAAERPRPGSVADVESTTAVSLQGGNKASDGGTYSDSSGRRRMSTGAAHGASSPGSSDAEGASELPKSAQDPNHLDIENQPYRGAAADADAGEIVLRTSLERLAFAGLAPMGLLQAGAGVGSSGLMRTTAAPVPLTSQQPQISGTGTMVAMSQRRSALAPLQAASVQPATSQADNGLALQPHDSPSKPPSLANYQGPTRQLWRPPSAQQTQDPLWTSSETVMASSEASGPTSDPLSRTFLNAGRRIPTLGTDGALAAAVARGTGDSIESSVDLLTSIDSVPAIAARPLHTIAGATLPHLLGRKEQAAGSHSTRGIEFSHSAGSDVESDEEGQVADGVQQGSMNIYKSEETGTGRGSSRREGAVFRLRQYGARRRKLMQQIGVNDPLLLSSASSLSTDSSTVSESNGDEVPMLLLRGLRGSTRRMP
ncbi:hypothetical protein Vafri_2281 [Volvox africanus]|nr:hypothetical protein Vafri_2281 [Volvox africanus]